MRPDLDVDRADLVRQGHAEPPCDEAHRDAAERVVRGTEERPGIEAKPQRHPCGRREGEGEARPDRRGAVRREDARGEGEVATDGTRGASGLGRREGQDAGASAGGQIVDRQTPADRLARELVDDDELQVARGSGAGDRLEAEGREQRLRRGGRSLRDDLDLVDAIGA